MLTDPRGQIFIQNFSYQWLNLGKLNQFTPDPKLYPTFTTGMRNSMKNETLSFMNEVFQQKRPIGEVLSANYTVVDQTMANWYQIPYAGTGSQKKLYPTGMDRAGITSHAAILALKSPPNHPSPVRRGAYILGNLLCQEPPPTPPDLLDEVAAVQVSPTESYRTTIEKVTSPSQCIACHQSINGIGFGLEGLGVLGEARTTDPFGNKIENDSTAFMQKYQGARALGQILEKQGFYSCFTEKLLTYATGRAIETKKSPDRCYVETLRQKITGTSDNIRALVDEIVLSDSFRKRVVE
jgi:hypothetical protein